MADEDTVDLVDEAAEDVIEGVAEVADDVEADETVAEAPDLDALAADLGWAPKDEWRGNPDDWKPAHEFLRGSVDASKALRETVKRQDRKLDEMSDTVKRMATAAEKSAQRSYERALDDAKDQMRQAVAEGDTEAYAEAEKRVGEIENERPDAETKADGDKTADADPDFKEFHGENPWYGGDSLTDIEKTAFAEQIAPVLGRKYSGAEFYRRLSEMVDEKFPDQAKTNPNRRRARSVETAGAARRSGSAKKTYTDLPAEAKAACDRFCEQKGRDGQPLMSRDEYVADYFSQE